MGKRLIILIGLSAILVGCNKGKVAYDYKQTYIYKNESGVDLRIEKFYNNIPGDIIAEIGYGATFSQVFHDDAIPAPVFRGVNAVRVVYNNEKYSVYTSTSGGPPDLLDPGHYKMVKEATEKDREYIREFTFTPEMYEAALPLEAGDE